MFTQYSTDIAMCMHSCTILSAKVLLVFLVHAYLEVICVRDTVITPDHEVDVVYNYSPSHIELHI